MAPSSEHLITPATIENIIHTACAQLKASSDTAKLDVELLLAHAINKDRTYLYTWNDKVVGES